jgi:hypothetical protein
LETSVDRASEQPVCAGNLTLTAEDRVEVLIPITLFLSVAAVLILRPMTSKVGSLLEALSRERMPARTPVADTDARVVALLEQISRRLELVEERVDFTERLVSSRPRDESVRPLRRPQAQVADY